MKSTARTWVKTGAIGIAGLAAGGVLATTFAATADDNNTTADGSAGTAADEFAANGSAGSAARSDEQPLTGDTADKVRAAALAKYPGATVERVESDSDGAYEVHLVTADGTPVEVQVGKDFAVTGTQEGGPAGFGHRGFGPGGGFGEEALTGATADKVRAAALAKYPGATVDRVEKDSDGVYEAHLVKADGTPVEVQVNKDFKVTGTREGGFGHDGFGGPDGDVPGAPTAPGTGSSDDSTTQSSASTL